MLYDMNKAIKIANQLQGWIEDREGFSSSPVASVSYAGNGVLEIGIGGNTVWSSEVDDEEEMTFEYCRNVFLEEVEYLRSFLKEAAKAVKPPPAVFEH